jgi:O-antigen/teichoic acid export membrane protein
MQKIATKVFIYASIAFGVLGILIVLTASGPDEQDPALSQVLIRLLFVTIFIILSSFALSVAGKYLNNKP